MQLTASRSSQWQGAQSQVPFLVSRRPVPCALRGRRESASATSGCAVRSTSSHPTWRSDSQAGSNSARATSCAASAQPSAPAAGRGREGSRAHMGQRAGPVGCRGGASAQGLGCSRGRGTSQQARRGGASSCRAKQSNGEKAAGRPTVQQGRHEGVGEAGALEGALIVREGARHRRQVVVGAAARQQLPARRGGRRGRGGGPVGAEPAVR